MGGTQFKHGACNTPWFKCGNWFSVAIGMCYTYGTFLDFSIPKQNKTSPSPIRKKLYKNDYAIHISGEGGLFWL